MPSPRNVQEASVQRRVADDPALVDVPGRERRHGERERDRQARRSRGRASAGGPSCRGSGGSGSGRRRRRRPACVANGLDTKTSRTRKNDATPPRIGTVQGSTSRTSRRLSSTAPPSPSRSGSGAQSSSEPSWPPQNARERVAGGKVAARVARRRSWNERSSARNAPNRTAEATRQPAKAAKNAFRAESPKPAAAFQRRIASGQRGVQREAERDREGGGPRPGTSGGLAVLRRVLRGALRHERVPRCRRSAVLERPLEEDVPSRPRTDRERSPCRRRDHRLGAVEVLQREAQAAAMGIAA